MSGALVEFRIVHQTEVIPPFGDVDVMWVFTLEIFQGKSSKAVANAVLGIVILFAIEYSVALAIQIDWAGFQIVFGCTYPANEALELDASY